jgi:hypothetical protein
MSWLKNNLSSIWPLLLIWLMVILFFWQFLLKNWLPIPADTIVGMYYPWRDQIYNGFTAGVPFKNFLITDPVRQQYPWRQLAMKVFQKNQIPRWNPYNFAGTPLLANFQSAVFYPLNILFFFLPFNFTWGLLVLLQPLMAGFFTFFYLNHLGLKRPASLLGAICIAFSGFSVAWLEWGTILHVALWLPLLLLATDKLIAEISNSSFTMILNSTIVKWSLVLVAGLMLSFFAGHLQTWFYLLAFSTVYLIYRGYQAGKKNIMKLSLYFLGVLLVVMAVTSIQWLPTVQLIKQSARNIDLDWRKPGWFIPWRHLVQFLAPDFFGNPTTLNYWGEWNYGEFVGYIGVVPLVLAAFAFTSRKKKEVLFFSLSTLLIFSLVLPTPWAKLPYRLHLPLLATSQPTRLLFLVDFCLAVLVALGMDQWLTTFRVRKREKLARQAIMGIFGIIYLAFWAFVTLSFRVWPEADWLENLSVAKRNLILPTALFGVFAVLVFGVELLELNRQRPKWWWRLRKLGLVSALIGLTIFDLLRFGWKFTPFTKEEWLFPDTKVIKFLQQDGGVFRVMAADQRLLPPNFSLVYGLQSVDGYDPLYLRRYGELIAAEERDEPNIQPPFGFNRIITPENFDSRVIDLLNVKYVLSLTDQTSPKLSLVFREGETRVYRNLNAFPRAFMVYQQRRAQNKQEAIELLMDPDLDLTKTVITEQASQPPSFPEGEAEVTITDYSENSIVIRVRTTQTGVLVLFDAYYPGWQATVDQKPVEIFRADYHFRGIIVPEGEHQVIFAY